MTARSSQPPDQSRRASASARERPRRRRGQSQTGAGGCDLAADGGEALLRPNMGNAEGGRWKGGKRPRPAVRRPVRVDAGGGASPVPHRPPGGEKKKKWVIGTRRACPLAPAGCSERARHGESVTFSQVTRQAVFAIDLQGVYSGVTIMGHGWLLIVGPSDWQQGRARGVQPVRPNRTSDS